TQTIIANVLQHNRVYSSDSCLRISAVRISFPQACWSDFQVPPWLRPASSSTRPLGRVDLFVDKAGPGAEGRCSGILSRWREFCPLAASCPDKRRAATV